MAPNRVWIERILFPHKSKRISEEITQDFCQNKKVNYINSRFGQRGILGNKFETNQIWLQSIMGAYSEALMAEI